MLSLADIVRVLVSYRGRYEFLDAFVDDIQELRLNLFGPSARLVASAPRPIIQTWVDGEWLSIELFSEQGIARFRLMAAAPKTSQGEAINAGVALGGALGAAVGAASAKKEGLLGGMVLGMLVGGLIGAAAAPVERALALQFDPNSSAWRLYDGPLLSWAKRTLIPAATA